jgi:hypothetical protein
VKLLYPALFWAETLEPNKKLKLEHYPSCDQLSQNNSRTSSIQIMQRCVSLTAIEHAVSVDHDWLSENDSNAGILATSTPRSCNALTTLKLSDSTVVARATPPIAVRPPTRLEKRILRIL